MSKGYAEIHLPYFKQGDDLRSCIVKGENGKTDVRATLKNHINLLSISIEILQQIHDNVFPCQNLDIDGDTHWISISGDPIVIDKLIQKRLASHAPHYDDEEFDVASDEFNEEQVKGVENKKRKLE